MASLAHCFRSFDTPGSLFYDAKTAREMAAKFRMLSVPHLIVIFIVALIVFGPEKIPELARNLGKIMAEFRRVTGDLRSTFEGHLRDLEREADSRKTAAPAASPTAAAMMPTAAPPAVPGADAQPVPASPGTVTSNPPNAAAIATPVGNDRLPAEPDAAPTPPDPMHDPYLMHMDFPPPDSVGETQPAEPEQNPERVTDGNRRSS
jgi:TatA/E family protein of Tat protein translocase